MDKPKKKKDKERRSKSRHSDAEEKLEKKRANGDDEARDK